MSMVLTNRHIGDAIRQRRFMFMPISVRGFIEFCKAGNYTVESNLPDDAIDCGAHLDSKTDMILLRVASMSFDPVKEGEQIPQFNCNKIKFNKK